MPRSVTARTLPAVCFFLPKRTKNATAASECSSELARAAGLPPMQIRSAAAGAASPLSPILCGVSLPVPHLPHPPRVSEARRGNSPSVLGAGVLLMALSRRVRVHARQRKAPLRSQLGVLSLAACARRRRRPGDAARVGTAERRPPLRAAGRKTTPGRSGRPRPAGEPITWTFWIVAARHLPSLDAFCFSRLCLVTFLVTCRYGGLGVEAGASDASDRDESRGLDRAPESFSLEGLATTSTALVANTGRA